MDVAQSKEPRTLTREELYALVWATPLRHLAPQFGKTDTGLRKICARLHVPCPPHGDWETKRAGKAVKVIPLPDAATGVPREVTITRSHKRSKPSDGATAALTAPDPSLHPIPLDPLGALHPVVQALISEHRRQWREKERATLAADGFCWFQDPGWSPIADLTERDLYRFRVFSTLLRAAEKHGARIKSASVDGKAALLLDGSEIPCEVSERMSQHWDWSEDLTSWTGIPYRHRSRLTSKGLLRVALHTNLNGWPQVWEETDRHGILNILPQIVAVLRTAGPYLFEQKRGQDEAHRRHLQDQMDRAEQLERERTEGQRWQQVREKALDWEEVGRLLAFASALEAKLAEVGDTTVCDQPLSYWIEWTRQRAKALDPLEAELRTIFEPPD